MTAMYGPQEATWDDVQAAHAAHWDAATTFGFGSPESIQACDLAEATHHSQIRGEARQADGHEAGLEAGQ